VQRHLIAVLCLAAATGAHALQAPRAPSIEVSGLAQPVEILTDRWGVPHIYARGLDDVFFAQGFQAARDRLWQIDLWRKRGLGQMARDFGPAYVEGDRMARAVLFRGSMYHEWLAYGPDAKRVAEAFVAGINAYVDLVEREPARLPEEFRILGYGPAHWTAADIVRIRHHGLTTNLSSEIARARAYCGGKADGEKVDWLRRELAPPVMPTVPEGLDPCSVPFADLTRAYALATGEPRFTRETLKTASAGDALAAFDAEPADLDAFGSNNWVIAPARSTTGRAILANDPHRSHSAPNLRYISHLVAPGLDVIGAGEPFLPGISIGHNGNIAFGLTRFYIDQEDLYVYELNPDNPDEYRYGNRWEPMTVVKEAIEVKGQEPRTVELRYTRHGPVLHVDAANKRAFALRAAWLEVGMAPYFGSIDYMRAADWEQFRDAMNRWGNPGESQVFADTKGNIGWIPAGLTPVRPNWDGLMPVPGDGRYEWAGFRDMDELPFEFRPPRGYIVTANFNNIPPDHPAASKGIGYEWADSARAMRLTEILEGKPRFSLADSERMQADTVSLQARRFLPLVHSLHAPAEREERALDLLRGWDADERRDSAAAAIFEVWFGKHLRPAVLAKALGAANAKLAAPGSAMRVTMFLEGDGLAPQARRDAMLASLATALDEIEKKLGPDMASWTWGAMHRARFAHPLDAVVSDESRERFTVSGGPLGGSGATPMATTYRMSDFALTAGASFRMVLDVGHWDASRVVNVPGQSGEPASPHYRDLLMLWSENRYFPLVYSRAAVEKATEARLRLVPAAAR
jgi:penicillin amidase